MAMQQPKQSHKAALRLISTKSMSPVTGSRSEETALAAVTRPPP
jgi:hypothetical protein